jgi:3D (Asp-Asp-Asp) domain-containing protein
MKNKIPLWFKVVYVLSVIVAFHFFLPVGIKEKTTLKDKKVEVDSVLYNAVPRDLIGEKAIEVFTGQLTGYGPDCNGCSGKTASGYNVKNGNIYFDDSFYGEVRIVAADRKFAIGTVVRITASRVSENPILAIVLDRGAAIKGNKFDLLFASSSDTHGIGRQTNVKFEVLRLGW